MAKHYQPGKYTIFLLYTADCLGDWHYVYGLEYECRSWIGKQVGDLNYRFKLMSREQTLKECKEKARELWWEREYRDANRMYNVRQRYARGSTPEFFGDHLILAKWRSNSGARSQPLYVTQQGDVFVFHSDEHVFKRTRSPKKALELFDTHATN